MNAVNSTGAESTLDRVASQLTGPLRDLGLDLEAVELTPAGKRRVLRVAVDKDGGVTMDDVADATREVGRILDESDVMGAHPFTLEVTSRGVDRPLTLPRHWRRNAGRLVSITLNDGEQFTGRIGTDDAVTDEGVRIDLADATRAVGYPDVAKALVQIEFNRPPEGDQD